MFEVSFKGVLESFKGQRIAFRKEFQRSREAHENSSMWRCKEMTRVENGSGSNADLRLCFGKICKYLVE